MQYATSAACTPQTNAGLLENGIYPQMATWTEQHRKMMVNFRKLWHPIFRPSGFSFRSFQSHNAMVSKRRLEIWWNPVKSIRRMLQVGDQPKKTVGIFLRVYHASIYPGQTNARMVSLDGSWWYDGCGNQRNNCSAARFSRECRGKPLCELVQPGHTTDLLNLRQTHWSWEELLQGFLLTQIRRPSLWSVGPTETGLAVDAMLTCLIQSTILGFRRFHSGENRCDTEWHLEVSANIIMRWSHIIFHRYPIMQHFALWFSDADVKTLLDSSPLLCFHIDGDSHLTNVQFTSKNCPT